MLEGLKITIVGLAWVFAGLALVWGLVVLLKRLFPARVAVFCLDARGGCTVTGT